MPARMRALAMVARERHTAACKTGHDWRLLSAMAFPENSAPMANSRSARSHFPFANARSSSVKPFAEGGIVSACNLNRITVARTSELVDRSVAVVDQRGD